MSKTIKKIVSFALAMCLLLGMLPAVAMQAEAATPDQYMEMEITFPAEVTGVGAGAYYPIVFYMPNTIDFQAGDKLVYDVWMSRNAGCFGAVDMQTDEGSLRDSGAVDQNGVSAHPNADLTNYASNTWYTRQIAIPDVFVNTDFSKKGAGPAVMLASDPIYSATLLAGTKLTIRYDNIRIVKADGSTRYTIFSGAEDYQASGVQYLFDLNGWDDVTYTYSIKNADPAAMNPTVTPNPEDKVLWTIGDSIMDYRDNSASDMVQTIKNGAGYDYLYMDNIQGSTVHSRGMGHSIMEHIAAGMYEDWGDPDTIVIFRGTNDTALFTLNQPGFSQNEIAASLNTVCSYFSTNYPNANIVYITPMWRYQVSEDAMNWMRNLIHTTTANYANISVLDLHLQSPFSNINGSNYTSLLYDGVHLNDAAAVAFKDIAISYLNNLAPIVPETTATEPATQAPTTTVKPTTEPGGTSSGTTDTMPNLNSSSSASVVTPTGNKYMEMTVTFPTDTSTCVGAGEFYPIAFWMPNTVDFAAGDKLVYDVWMSRNAGGFGAVDLCSGGLNIHDTGVDQNGIPAHPVADVSVKAALQWYTREITLPAAFADADFSALGAGPAVMFPVQLDYNPALIAGETITVKFDNIKVVDAEGNVKYTIFTGDEAYVPYGENWLMPNLTGWSAVTYNYEVKQETVVVPPAPSTEATEPSSEATEPSSEATEPSSEATEPSSEATEPSSEATEPSSEATEPSSEATEPSSEATEPSSEATEPSSEATEPSSEATEPSSEATEPAEPDILDVLGYEVWAHSVSIISCDAAFTGKLEIPETIADRPVQSINESAFYNCTGITEIVIPQSVNVIGNGAFYGCAALEEVELPAELFYIGSGTFAACTNLTTISVPARITSIGIGAFDGCAALETIYFAGSPSQWSAIYIDSSNNSVLANVEIVFAEEDPTQPTTEATEPSTEATEPSTEAPQPTTEATEPSTEAPQPTTEATEPTLDPNDPHNEYVQLTVKIPQDTSGCIGTGEFYPIAFWLPNDLVFETGDKLIYDVWMSRNAGGFGAIDLCSGPFNLRDTQADQNGIPAHPTADPSTRCALQWYTREIPITPTFMTVDWTTMGAGPAVMFPIHLPYSPSLIAGETIIVKYDNIKIVAADGTVKHTVFTDDEPMVPYGENWLVPYLNGWRDVDYGYEVVDLTPDPVPEEDVFTFEAVGDDVFYYKNGELYTVDTLAKYEGRWLHFKDGKWVKDTTLVKRGGKWNYVENGVLNTKADKLIKFNGKWYHVKNGSWQQGENTLYSYSGKMYYLYNGVWKNGITKLLKYNGKYYYLVNGVVNMSNKLVKFDNKWYHVKDGTWQKGEHTLFKYSGKWYYLYNGIMNKTDKLFKFSGKWYHVKNGTWQQGENALYKVSGKWYAMSNGVVNMADTLFSYDGKLYHIKSGYWQQGEATKLYKYNNVWYYLVNGVVNKTTTVFSAGGKLHYVTGGKWTRVNTTVTVGGKTYKVTNGYATVK